MRFMGEVFQPLWGETRIHRRRNALPYGSNRLRRRITHWLPRVVLLHPWGPHTISHGAEAPHLVSEVTTLHFSGL